MPNVPVVDVANGASAGGERNLSDAVFGVRPNRHVLYEAVKHYRARRHRGTHATKNRAMVRGGGHKPWRQKGTGRARVGSSRNPLWRKGGTVFGPQVRDYGFKLNGKVQRGALRSALSLRVGEESLTVVSGLAMETPSTKSLRSTLDGLGAEAGRVLIVDAKPGEALLLSARNLPKVEVRSVASLHAYDVLAARRVFLTEDAAASLEEKLSR
jgi:large subunit ribosomal protein L4